MKWVSIVLAAGLLAAVVGCAVLSEDGLFAEAAANAGQG